MKLDRPTLQKLFRYGYSLTANEQDAYDLLHHVLEKLIQKGIEPEHPDRYIMRAMKHTWIDWLRQRQRVPMVPMDETIGNTLDLSEDVLENQVIASQELAQIWPNLQQDEREILFMWAVEGYSASEIGQQMETSRNTILSRMHRLRLRIKALLNKRHQEVP